MIASQALKGRKLEHDKILLREYISPATEERMYKLIYFQTLRASGIEDAEDRDPVPGVTPSLVKEPTHIARARRRIFELAYCNPWAYFFTGTLSPDKQDRTDLDGFRRAFADFARKLRYRREGYSAFRYLLVPELHADGQSWHVHGFLAGVPDADLHRFRLGDTMGAYIAQKVRQGETVYDWLPYSRRFGFCDLEPVQSPEAAARYVTKYISKALDRSVSEVGKHLYYASQGLQGSTLVRKTDATSAVLDLLDACPETVSWDYGKSLWLHGGSPALDALLSALGAAPQA